MANTATPSACLSCGVPLSGEARQGFCPKCLFVQAKAGIFEAANDGVGEHPEPEEPATSVRDRSCTSSWEPEAGRPFGDYELLEVIGRGGMGMVYRARQRTLDRTVAIKMMAFGPGSSPELIKRFRAEAVAAAALQHPNIVAIHEVGIHQERHFFVMDYVEGQSLAQLTGGHGLPARRAAQYLKTIAEAVHYAHERGILHRDLKPSNVLIDGQDRPRVVDFGLARRLEGDSELTVSGQVLGSPHYLPPEQATGRRGRVSRRTDVYGLGATLYHLLTGRPPFQAESLAETLHLVLHSEPVAPRLLNPGLPRDLETICLKCLEKEPAQRYPTAEVVAEELGRFLDGQPILARPIGAAGKAGRWCRRNPRLATAVGMAFLILVIGLAGVSWQWRRAESQRQRAESGERLAQRNAYAADMKEVQRALEDSDLGRALELLNRHRPVGTPESLPRGGTKSEIDLRGWEWRYLWGRCQSDERFTLCRYSNAIAALALSADGKWLAIRPQNSPLVVWDAVARRPVAEFTAGTGRWRIKGLAFSPREALVAWSSQDAELKPAVAVRNLSGARETTLLPHPSPIRSISIAPDGNLMATLADDGYVRIWDLPSRQVVESHSTARLDRNRERFLAVEKADGMASPKTAARPRPERAPTRFSNVSIWSDHYGCVLFSPDGRWLAIGELSPQIRLLDRTTGQESKRILLPPPDDAITALAFSPDSRLLAAGCGLEDNEVHLWDLSVGREVRLAGHSGCIVGLAFSPDGQMLASASADQTVRIWDLRNEQERRRLHGNTDEVWAVAWSPDGTTLLTGAKDGSIRCWDPFAKPSVPFAVLPEPIRFWGPAFLSDSKTFLAVTRPAGAVVQWDAATAQVVKRLDFLGTNHTSIEISRSGRWLALGDAVGNIQIWDFPAQRVAANLSIPGCFVFALIFSPFDDILGGAGFRTNGAATAKLWDVGRWSELNVAGVELEGGIHADFSPDEGTLAVGYANGSAAWWDLRGRRRLALFDNRYAGGAQVAFSPDGRLFATGGFDGRLRVWDCATRRPRDIGRGYRNGLHQLIFSPDSRRLVASGTFPEGVIKLWDVETGRDVAILPGEPGTYSRIGFSPDGNTLFAASREGTALLWRAPSFAEIEAREKEARPQ